MDAATFYWVVGGMGALFLAIIGWVVSRQAADRADAKESRTKQWDAHTKLREDHHGLERRMLENMFTKADAKDMEQRITDTIKETAR